MDSREQFEQWAKGYSLIAKGLHRFTEHSAYADALTHSAWQAWQASREALVVKLPDPIEVQDTGDFMCCVIDELDQAGVRYE